MAGRSVSKTALTKWTAQCIEESLLHQSPLLVLGPGRSKRANGESYLSLVLTATLASSAKYSSHVVLSAGSSAGSIFEV